MKEVEQKVITQCEQREMFCGRSIETAIDHLIEEAQELKQSVLNDDDAVHVASEIGDVGYLLFVVCHMTGIKLDDAVKMKILRNEFKYPVELTNTGNHDEARQVIRETWDKNGGDAKFFEWYEQNS